VWFKAGAAVQRHEPALATFLAAQRPDLVLTPLAADVGRGWLLLPDGGTPLREVPAARRDAARWERLLQAYAGLQLALAGRADALLATGLHDRRPAALPPQLEELLADDAAVRGLHPGERRRLRAAAPPAVDRLVVELEALGVPPSLGHGDLHDANVFVHGAGHRLFDWGDASLAHPFCGLVVTLRSAARALAVPEDDAAVARLRNAYLEPWTALAEPAAVRRAASLAERLAPLLSALTWRAALADASPAELLEWGEAVPRWLRALLAAVDE
jgi:hypothetical protein